MSSNGEKNKSEVLTAPRGYFTEAVQSAIEKRKLKTNSQSAQYLVELLESYIITPNIGLETSFAEAFLAALQADKVVRRNMLKKVADTSLYLTGFFGDSLKRKIVDIDYYAEIGGTAYANLAGEAQDQERAALYREFSSRFLDYVEVLTLISQSAKIQTNQDLLRLYERYVTTGSQLAKEQLIEKGLISGQNIRKISNQ